MELLGLEQIADTANILGYVNRSRGLLKSKLSDVVGTKAAYVERAITTLSELEGALKGLSISLTSLSVLQEIRTRIVELEGALQPNGQDLDVQRVLELSDRILAQMPLLQSSTKIPIAPTTKSLMKAAEKLGEDLEIQAGELKTLSDNAKAQINGLEVDVRNEANTKLEEIRNSTEKIDKLRSFVAGKALSSEFANQADNENNIVWWWTLATGILASITFILLGLFFLAQFGIIGDARFQNVAEATYIAQITTKVLLTLTLGLTTRWASKRANFHLSQVTKYRRIALCMDSLDSFVATLEPASKDRIIAFVTAKLLTEDSLGDPQSEFDTVSVTDLLKQITDKAKSNTSTG